MRTDFESGTFYRGDCFDVMRTLPDKSVDCIVTSPPYDDLRTYNDGDSWDWPTFERVSAECVRVLKVGGCLVWVVGDATKDGTETGTSFRHALHFKDTLGMSIHDTMIWNKGGFSAVGATAVRYGPVFEYMFVFSKGKIATFNPIKDRKNKHAGKVIGGTIRQDDGIVKKMSSYGNILGEYGIRFNIWNVGPHRQKGGHPAPFPVSLAQDHILSWSNSGDTILDPFAGSGTTAIAAENAGRKWICIERDEVYYDKAVHRVREHLKQQSLFGAKV